MDEWRSSPGRRLLKETTRSRSQLCSCLRELERASAFTAKNEEDAGRKKTPEKNKGNEMCCQSFVSSMARATNQRCLQRCRLDCYSSHSITTVRVSYIRIPAEYTLNRSDILPVPRLTSTALSPPPAPTRPSLTKISSTLNSQHSIKTFRSSHARFPCTSHSHTKQCNTHALRLQHVLQQRQSVQGEKEALIRKYSTFQVRVFTSISSMVYLYRSGPHEEHERDAGPFNHRANG